MRIDWPFGGSGCSPGGSCYESPPGSPAASGSSSSSSEPDGVTVYLDQAGPPPCLALDPDAVREVLPDIARQVPLHARAHIRK